MQYVIDTGDEKKDDDLLSQIRATANMQRRMIPSDKVRLLIGEEIK